MDNIKRLGNTLASRMQKAAGAAVPTTLELGIITGNLSLKVDSFPTPIPQSEYMIPLRLTGTSYTTEAKTHTHSGGEHAQYTGSGSHTHSDGNHGHKLPSCFRGIKAGDRVLVAWVGHEPVIVDIVVSGKTQTGGYVDA